MLEWTWNPYEERKWQRHYDCLLEFIRREGHMGVPKNHVEETVELGVWIGEQYEECENETLSPDHRKKLEALPCWCRPEGVRHI
ncbi:MAG: hypothetical protein GY847_41890 [Proteobacteria bacterium]|nr:hypothetical protein [Pseudomonadota bacterium]